jgi:hypothetical protein
LILASPPHFYISDFNHLNVEYSDAVMQIVDKHYYTVDIFKVTNVLDSEVRLSSISEIQIKQKKITISTKILNVQSSFIDVQC